MTGRVLTASCGGLLGALPVVLAAALSPWRPASALVAVGVLVLVSATAALGVGSILRARGMDAPGLAARVTALGTPIMVILWLFLVLNAVGAGDEGAQQIVALLVGPTAAAWLAARFSVSGT